tara:strand:+ start:104 stop:358 length:255 start_codon:yes stop_codon:yes gene_type:complete
MNKNARRVRAKKVRAQLQKRKRKMADLTKAQLVEQMDKMKSVEGVMDTILEMNQEDIQTLARTIKTTQKGMKVHNAILFGIKQN